MPTPFGRVRATPTFAGLLVLSLPSSVLAAPASAHEREYRGPTSPEATTPPTTPPDQSPSGSAPDAPPVAPPPVVVPTPTPEVDAEAEDSGEGDDGFFIEDLSDDPEALEKELAVETKAVKGPSGKVSGQVKDMTTGDPLLGVTVEVIGTEYRTKTGADGSYTLELPPGTYELRVREDTHEPRRFSNVEVAVDASTSIDTELKALAGAGETVIVEAEMPKESSGARLAQRKEAVETRDIMSRDDITKSGGGSTSAVARRIVGATVVDGKYLFVRGLGHRYGNTLLDMARVPSPEPEIRTVPLDVFPSSTLSAINVQKTFTPDVPADFAGASIQLETREVPDELVFGVGADIGVNTATTGRSGMTDGESFGADWFGFGTIPRALPDAIPRGEQAAYGATDENFNPRWTPAEIEAQGESLLLDTALSTMKGMPNFGVDLNVGYGDEVGDAGHLGFLLATQWGSEQQTLRGIERQWGISDGELTPQVTLDTTQTTHNVQWSGLGLVKFEPNDHHELALSGLYSRDADDRALWWEGTANTFASGADAVITRQWYSARSIGFSRLGGDHEFPSAGGLKVDWLGSYAQSQRNDPHIRDMVYTRPVGTGEDVERDFRYDDQNGAGTYTFLDLVDHTESGALNFTLPFKQWSGNLGNVKVGAWAEGKQREFFARRFKFRVAQGLQDLVPEGTGTVLSADTVGGGITASQGGTEPFYLLELTRATDNYTATQEIYAGYGLLELPLVRWLKIAGGLRFEWNDIEVTPYDLFSDEVEESRVATLRGSNWLPSLSLVFSPTPKQNVRLGASQTLARPELRELAPFEFYDFLGGNTVQGNPYLETSRIWNADLRWEWFVSANEVLAASVFYKYFDDPIERVVAPRIPLKTTFLNAELAHNVGLELEVRKNLEFLAGRKDKKADVSDATKARVQKARSVLADFSLGLNFAYVFSWVELPPDRECAEDDDECNFEQQFDVSTSRERPLQGQAPYVLNAFIDYTNDDSGTTVRALFNTFGRYISDVGGLGLPDIYQESILDLDFVVLQRIYQGLSASFEVDNALNWTHQKTQADELTQRWRTGVTFTFGLSWSM